MSKNMIKKIELDLDGKRVSLTLEQAKKLKDTLNELFGEKIVKEKEYIPYPQPYPQPYPVEPYRPWRPWRWDDRPFYYKTTGGTLCNYRSGSGTLKLTI